MEHIKRLREDGVAMLYVTHRLEEMFEIGDWVTVLRDGGLSESGPMSAYDEDKLITAMVGREITSLYPDTHKEPGTPLLRVRGLQREADGPTIDFDLRGGEILGIGGLLGSGRSELLLSLFGATPIVAGEIEVDGVAVKPTGPRTMMNAGIGLLTEDRKVLGLLPELSIRENVTIASLRRGSRHGLLPPKEMGQEADKLLDSLRLRAGSYDQPVSTLSGGNQQKVLLARWLLTKPKILVFDEPTKGIDVGAKGELYTVIGDLAAAGLGIIVVSSYLPELLGLADRILVLKDGAVAGELGRSASEEDVLRLASGGGARPAAPPRTTERCQKERCTTDGQAHVARAGAHHHHPQRAGGGDRAPGRAGRAGDGQPGHDPGRRRRAGERGPGRPARGGGGAHPGQRRLPHREQPVQPGPPGGHLRHHRGGPAAGDPDRGHRPGGGLDPGPVGCGHGPAAGGGLADPAGHPGRRAARHRARPRQRAAGHQGQAAARSSPPWACSASPGASSW